MAQFSPVKNGRNTRLVMVNCIANIPLQEALGLLKKRHLLVVDKEWLMESIGGWEIRSLMPHEDEEAEEQK